MDLHPAEGAVERARAGDPEAWRELYTAYAGRLQVWLGTVSTGDTAQAAEDVAGEVWLTAARRIGRFSGTESDFAGWLFGIGRNILLNARRRSMRRNTTPSLVDGDDAAWGVVDDESTAVLGRDSVRRLLALLPAREAEVVASLDVVGLDVATTSRALGISATAVRVAHHRGLGRLRKHLAPPADQTPEADRSGRSGEWSGIPGGAFRARGSAGATRSAQP